MNKLDLATAAELIDFSGNGAVSADLSKLQLEGAVALHNILSDIGVAYLADEVGMGKTYVALGVVALMRRFKPDLRVLYLLPKNNVRDKWLKDYRSFIDKNYRLQDGVVKGFGNSPAAPNRLCSSLSDLTQTVATASVRDYFICTSAFSLPIGGTAKELSKTLDRLRAALPQNGKRVDALIEELTHVNFTDVDMPAFKLKVKQFWAESLNGILPQFDLVVVDEAHNYRRGLQSADRNQLLATVLGTDKNSSSKPIKRINRVLLLSATPFDREIGQLKRQLELFAKGEVLKVSPKASWDQIHNALKPFMVRRLNRIMLGEKAHTRNMYRTEHRSGVHAEVKLGLEQQLFAALLQKKVSESLNENNSGKFELGMLASFESYLPLNNGKPVQFDGINDQLSTVEGRERDAPDRTVVEYLINDYQSRFRAFPPHPKMDVVAHRAKVSALDANKKQLIFVRRVGSVGELKAKIEDSYNHWIAQYVANDPAVTEWFSEYQKRIGERQLTQFDDEFDEDKANLSSFFAWFYRGNNELLAKVNGQLQITPFNYRNLLGSASMMFATNWSALPGMPRPDQLDFSSLTELPSLPVSPTRIQQFERAQYAYLCAIKNGAPSSCARVAQRIFSLVYSDVKTESAIIDASSLVQALNQKTFWEVIQTQPDLVALGLNWTNQTFEALAVASEETDAESIVRKIIVHHRLAAALCRLDHPFIDLYALRGSRGKSEDRSADENLIEEFSKLLISQSKYPNAFSSFTILRDLFANFDLLLKQNFEDVADKPIAELTTYITRQLQPLSPVLGASGVNSASRSAIARKFRMPGYPRVLVSTDVFQEGEDLHTFCDSVVHYGISANPISLEQKVGRVDRIASLSHRAMKSVTTRHEDHYIQVGFPHIRESLEFLHVRLAARNLNQFLLSMNKIGDAGLRPTIEIELAELLLDSSPIEPPLVDELKSPFEVLPSSLDGCNKTDELIKAQCTLNEKIKQVQSTIETCIRKETDQQVSLRPSAGRLHWKNDNGMSVSLKGAHGLDKLILSITAPYLEAYDESAAKGPSAAEYLSQLQENPLIRLQQISVSDDSLSRNLRRNAEIFAGSNGILSEKETLDLYHRVTGEVTHVESSESIQNNLPELVASICGRHGSYQVKQGGSNELIYQLDVEGRTQNVMLGVLDGYVVLTAQILDTKQTADLVVHKELLVQHTLYRNAVFDMVDFHIDKDFALAVRAIHPLTHFNMEEFERSLSMVALEANRLKQILFPFEQDDEDESGDEATAVSKAVSYLSEWAADNNVMCIVRDVLSKGPLTLGELIRKTAYGLGYKRAALGISTALKGTLIAAARRGITMRNGNLVQLKEHLIADYDDDHLKTQFLAAISHQTSGFIEREEAVRVFARWMGYARTGPVIADRAASLIRKLIRSGLLQSSGSQIRRHRS